MFGFHQGFDRYRQPARLWRDVRTKIHGDDAVAWALELVDGRDRSRPLYLQLMLIDAHAPATPHS